VLRPTGAQTLEVCSFDDGVFLFDVRETDRSIDRMGGRQWVF
jgi:hypothetical protein